MSTFVTTGWVNELVAGGAGGAKGFMFFICNMELTTEGLGKFYFFSTCMTNSLLRVEVSFIFLVLA